MIAKIVESHEDFDDLKSARIIQLLEHDQNVCLDSKVFAKITFYCFPYSSLHIRPQDPLDAAEVATIALIILLTAHTKVILR